MLIVKELQLQFCFMCITAITGLRMLCGKFTYAV